MMIKDKMLIKIFLLFVESMVCLVFLIFCEYLLLFLLKNYWRDDCDI